MLRCVIIANQFEDIFCFFWLNPGGVAKFTWYNVQEENDVIEDREALLSGFISALMSVSQEVFGDHISNTEIASKLITFERLANNDTLALVTNMDFDPAYSKAIFLKLEEYISNAQLPVPTGDQDQFNFIEPVMLDAIHSSLPQSLEASIIPFLETQVKENKSQAYLAVSENNNVNQRLLRENLDFELETFLNSVFWEKLALVDKECVSLAEKSFEFGQISWILIQTPFNILAIILTRDGFISESFDVTMKYDIIHQVIHELIQKINPVREHNRDLVSLNACSPDQTEISTAFDELNGFCGITGVFLYDPIKKIPIFNQLPSPIDNKKALDFINIYIKKQQMGLDIVPEVVGFYGDSNNLFLFPHNGLYLICFTSGIFDLNLILEKIKETWVRYDIGM